MKVHEIINETFGEGFADSPYGENAAAEIEQGRMRDEMSSDFQNDRTPVTEFDLDELQRRIMNAARNKSKEKRQEDSILDEWKVVVVENAFSKDEDFNKAIKSQEDQEISNKKNNIHFNENKTNTK